MQPAPAATPTEAQKWETSARAPAPSTLPPAPTQNTALRWTIPTGSSLTSYERGKYEIDQPIPARLVAARRRTVCLQEILQDLGVSEREVKQEQASLMPPFTPQNLEI
jgi:hypothetical protein